MIVYFFVLIDCICFCPEDQLNPKRFVIHILIIVSTLNTAIEGIKGASIGLSLVVNFLYIVIVTLWPVKNVHSYKSIEIIVMKIDYIMNNH